MAVMLWSPIKAIKKITRSTGILGPIIIVIAIVLMIVWAFLAALRARQTIQARRLHSFMSAVLTTADQRVISLLMKAPN